MKLHATRPAPPSSDKPIFTGYFSRPVKNFTGSYQSDLDRMVQGTQCQAHFVGYAPPAVRPFSQGSLSAALGYHYTPEDRRGFPVPAVRAGLSISHRTSDSSRYSSTQRHEDLTE